MGGSRKKVVVRRFLPGPLWGYLPQSGMVAAGAEPMLDLLDLSGRAQPVSLQDVKYVCYVRDWNTGDNALPERLVRKIFLTRPRTEGLWLRLTLRDGDKLEGLAPLDLSLADGWAEDLGVLMVPPDTRANTQQIYVPRLAIAAMETVAVVTTPTRKQTAAKAEEKAQADLFSLEMTPGTRPQ